jgi:hypothetical protein
VSTPLRSPARPTRLRRGTLLWRVRSGIDRLPDRRGESLDIFTTIFVRPALEFRPAVARFARHLCTGGGTVAFGPVGRLGSRPVENRS